MSDSFRRASEYQKKTSSDSSSSNCCETNSRNLIEAVKSDNIQDVLFFLANDADPNFLDEDGFNALHHAAALGYRTSVKILVASGKCNYLIPDGAGRLASDLAREWTEDRALVRWLKMKENEQGRNQAAALIARVRYGPSPF